MVKQNTTIKLRLEQIEELKAFGKMGDTWPDVIEKVLNLAKQANCQTDATHQTDSTEFKEAKVDKYGKAMISRTLAGQPIEWRVKK